MACAQSSRRNRKKCKGKNVFIGNLRKRPGSPLGVSLPKLGEATRCDQVAVGLLLEAQSFSCTAKAEAGESDWCRSGDSFAV